MSYLDKTFCDSPQCKNDCGRRMTDEERSRLTYLNDKHVSYGYFCGEPELIATDINEDLMPKAIITIIDGVQELVK